MQQITIESALGDQLSKLPGEAILRDGAGRAIGFFSPLHGRPRVEDLQLEPPHSIAETEELRKTRTGKPLSEILERLGFE